MKKHINIVCFVFLSLSAWMLYGQSKKTQTSNPKEVPSTMYMFRTHLLELQPYLISEQAFTDKKNEKEVLKHLEAFAQFSKSLKKHEKLKTQGFEPTADQLQHHLDRTYQIYKGGNKSYAWWLFRSSIHGCNQCHTQVAYRQAPSLDLEEASISGTPFDQAEFWYAIRDYHRALMFYHSVISRFGNDGSNEQQLRLSLDRILSITLRIDRSPKKAIEILTTAKEHPQISKSIKNSLETWISDLNKILSSSIPDPSTASLNELETYASKHLGEKNKISSVFVSGLLLEFVNKHSKKASANVLYWLGTSLEETENDIFFTTSEHYYKNCIEKFSASPVAKKCLEALKAKWTEGFTGSSGTDLPAEYQRELQRLESKIK